VHESVPSGNDFPRNFPPRVPHSLQHPGGLSAKIPPFSSRSSCPSQGLRREGSFRCSLLRQGLVGKTSLFPPVPKATFSRLWREGVFRALSIRNANLGSKVKEDSHATSAFSFSPGSGVPRRPLHHSPPATTKWAPPFSGIAKTFSYSVSKSPLMFIRDKMKILLLSPHLFQQRRQMSFFFFPLKDTLAVLPIPTQTFKIPPSAWTRPFLVIQRNPLQLSPRTSPPLSLRAHQRGACPFPPFINSYQSHPFPSSTSATWPCPLPQDGGFFFYRSLLVSHRSHQKGLLFPK